MSFKKEKAAGGNQTAVNIKQNKSIKSNLSRQLNFQEINSSALAVLPSLLSRWLPDGKAQGREYTARNPRRSDHRAGSFKVNTYTGRWADFATGDKGGDVISLAAYLSGKTQSEAARELARMLGVSHE